MDPRADACRINAEMYPNVIPREEICAANRFAFSASSSSWFSFGIKGVDSVVEAEEDARDDSTTGSTCISG